MPKRTTSFDLATITLAPGEEQPLYRQLYESVRRAVLHGQLAAGARLPSTRDLCATLGLSRNTVVTAFDQLIAEGYLESRVGDGTYVTNALPDAHLTVPPRRAAIAAPPADPPLFSQRLQSILRSAQEIHKEVGIPRPFRVGVPGLDEFPLQTWARLVAYHWRRATPTQLGYGAPLGYLPLRQAVADYLGAARGVRCTAEQVIITSGSQDALNLVTLLLLNPGDPVWLEDPGYRGARAALLSAGATITPVPVDQEGLDLAAGIRLQPQARLVYVTPSHQYPLGVIMSLARRLALIDWARQTGAWLVEDDYDSEYRYQGRPLSSLQGLDDAGRVLYIGTFSKVLFPALRLGYLVIPTALVEGLQRALLLMQHYLPGVEQAVLADFINEGHFARHIRQMRLLYAERQQTLLATARQELGDQLAIHPSEAGLHVTGLLAAGVDDRLISARALRLGVEAQALSSYALGKLARGGLVLGYAGLTAEQIKEGVGTLRRVLAGGQ